MSLHSPCLVSSYFHAGATETKEKEHASSNDDLLGLDMENGVDNADSEGAAQSVASDTVAPEATRVGSGAALSVPSSARSTGGNEDMRPLPSLRDFGDAEFDVGSSSAMPVVPNPSHSGIAAETNLPADAAFEMKEGKGQDYLTAFEKAVAAEEVVIGMVSEEELRQREAVIEAERLQRDAEEADRFAERELRLSAAEAAAKRRVWHAQQSMADTLRRRDDYFADQAHKRETAIHRAFRRAETGLRERLQQQQGVVQERYGSLLPDQRRGAGTRELRVEWRGLPQPVEIQVSKIRAVKNKLPSGRYVLLCTMYDRLGGAPLRWSKVGKAGGLASAGYSGATKPTRHWGRFFDTELKFDQAVYAMLPPPTSIRPSNVLVFELFLLGGRRSPVDRVVAWSAMPAADADFRPIDGKFRLPLLRGELNLNLDMFSKLELAISDDLDNWLGNMYVEIKHLPRSAVVDGTTVREYDAVISYTSEMLGLSSARAQRVNRGRNAAADEASGGPIKEAEGAQPISEKAGLLADDPGVEDFISDDEDGYDSASDVDGEKEDAAVGAARVMTHRDHRSRYTKNKPSAYSSTMVGSKPRVGGSAYSSTLAGGSRPSAYSSTLTPNSKVSGASGSNAYKSVFSAGGGSTSGAGAYTSTLGGGRPAAGAYASMLGGGGNAYASVLAGKGAGGARKRNPYASMEMGNGAGAGGASGGARVAADNQALSAAAAMAGKGGVRFAGAYAAERNKARDMVGAAARHGGAGDDDSGTLTTAGILGAVPGVVQGSTAGAARRHAADQAMAAETRKLHHYMYAVTRQDNKGVKGRRLPDSARKVRFMTEELVADLAFPSLGNVQFWIQLTLLLLALYFRIYIHYLGQWLLLRALRVPVYTFSPTGYNILLKYVPGVLPFEFELGVVVMGPISNAIALGMFIFAAWLCLLLVRHIPEMYSRFVAFYGVATCLDPLLIFLVDAAAGFYFCQEQTACANDISSTACVCHEGDAWKLYNRFLADEGSGVAGVILTVFLYLVLFMVAAFFTYLFLLNMHMDGRMLDVYRRLNAHESAFLVPHDMEVSLAELKDVAAKTARWRGTQGKTRKIAVCDYVLTDPLDDGFREVTSHIIIYEAGLDGSRELYRHFLRLPDGAITEVFGDMSKQFGVGTTALQEVLLQNGSSKTEDIKSFFSGLA